MKVKTMEEMKPNLSLRRERELRGWSQRMVADHIGTNPQTVTRWELGNHKPTNYFQTKLCELFGKSAEELGFIAAPPMPNREPEPQTEHSPFMVISKQNSGLTEYGGTKESTLILPAAMMQTEKLEKAAHLDSTILFGLQLAQAITLIHQWFGLASFSHDLQNQLDQEIKKLDWLKTQNSFEAFALSRRSFLTTLATLPIALLTSTQEKYKMVLNLEEVLPTFAAGITACWHLSGGGHLDAILPIIDSYLPTLVNICKHTSAHREVAADLIAQIYFLKAILSWHLEGLDAAEIYCNQALSYSDLTKNVNLRLTALNQNALIAYYRKDFREALEKSKEADEMLRQASHTHIFSIVKGRVYMYLAAIQAQQKLREAKQTLENAQTAFLAQSTTTEFIPMYADCGDASLLLWDGLTHYYLGRRDSKQARKALTSLSVSGQLQSSFSNPERFRLECLNNRILAAIQLNDLEETLACFEAGRQGARNLGSKQRMAEVNYAYQLMLHQWPMEKRVKQLNGEELAT